MPATHYIEVPAYGSSPYWLDPVANFAALPTGQIVGELRITTDTGEAYQWDGSAWDLVWQKAPVGPGFVTSDASGVFDSQAKVSLTADVSGILPVENGGTNSDAALSNNRVMKSSAGAVIEAAAITAARALISDANGIPVASAVTGTELGYVGGVTSALQTQLGNKEATITAGTSSQYYRGDKSFQTLNAAALLPVTDGSAGATGKIGEVLSSSVAANTVTGVGATGVYGSVTSLSLTAGSWHVWATAGFNDNGATLTTGLQVGISASASGAGISEFDSQLAPFMTSGSSDALLATPVVIVDISSTTTYYLNTKFWYTAGGPKHRGRIQARRIR
jgi:hypothetical protein